MSIIWGATGSMTTTDAHQVSPPSQQYSRGLNMNDYCGFSNLRAPPSATILPQYQPQPQLQPQPQPQQMHHGGGGSGSGTGSVGFRGTAIFKTMKKLGHPSLTDPTHGGIAIWNASTLKYSGHSYLNRVEVIDEKVVTTVPVPHTANVYIWVRIPMTRDQMTRVLEMSPNFLYDQQKKMLIVRSKCIRTAVGMAALVSLYADGKVSMYQINSYDLLRKYFVGSLNDKQYKTFKAIIKRRVR